MEKLNIKGNDKINLYYKIVNVLNNIGLVGNAILAFIGVIIFFIDVILAITGGSTDGAAIFGVLLIIYAGIGIVIVMFSKLVLKINCSAFYDLKILRMNNEEILDKISRSNETKNTVQAPTTISTPTYSQSTYKKSKGSNAKSVLIWVIVIALVIAAAVFLVPTFAPVV